jgi:hypothetical protein
LNPFAAEKFQVREAEGEDHSWHQPGQNSEFGPRLYRLSLHFATHEPPTSNPKPPSHFPVMGFEQGSVLVLPTWLPIWSRGTVPENQSQNKVLSQPWVLSSSQLVGSGFWLSGKL